MQQMLQSLRPVLRFRYLPVTVIVMALAVLGGTILLARQHLGRTIREQIAGRDGAVLHAVAVTRLGEEFADELSVVLEASRLKGVMGVRLFNPEGRYLNAVGPTVSEADLAPEDLATLKQLKPVSRFYSQAHLSDFISQLPDADPKPEQRVPLLEVTLPLHQPGETRLLALAQFIIEGHSIAAEFATLDRNLVSNAAITFLAGGTMLVLILGWAFHRLQRTNRLLADRTANLLQANQELALAARTSAVGAVAAYLIHGLKNPLSGLQNFVASRSQKPAGGTDTDWFHAVSSTRRMHALINDVVNVLRDEQNATHYEMTLAELMEIVSARVRPVAQSAGVGLKPILGAEGIVSNRVANLVTLIVVSLLQNAIEATPQGKSVTLKIWSAAGKVRFEVRDEGPGLSANAQKALFTPCKSSKDGGSGIGLAISKQLANHLGASLELESNKSDGCVFGLTLPDNLVLPPSGPASSAMPD